MTEPVLGQWGLPSALYNFETNEYDRGGAIWYGEFPPEPEDYQPLLDRWEQMPIDIGTIFGTADERWSTWRDRNKDKPQYNQNIVVG